MKPVENIGGLPKFLKVFLTNKLTLEEKTTKVWDCKYLELIKLAQTEKLEPAVLIDRKDTGRAFICAVGAGYEKNEFTDQVTTPPAFYFAELDDSQIREFSTSLTTARKDLYEKTVGKREATKKMKAATRAAGKKLAENI